MSFELTINCDPFGVPAQKSQSTTTPSKKGRDKEKSENRTPDDSKDLDWRESISMQMGRATNAIRNIGAKVGAKEAIVKPKYPTCYARRRIIMLFLEWLAVTISYMCRTLMSVAVIPIASENGWNKQQTGLILSSFYWGFILSNLPSAILSRKYGGKLMTFVGVLGVSISAALVPFAVVHLELLICTQVLVGFFGGIIMPASMHLIAEWHPRMEKSRVVSIIYSGTTVGSTISLFTSPSLIEVLLWPRTYWLYACLGGVWIVLWIIFAAETPTIRGTRLGNAFCCRVHTEEAKYIVRYRDKARETDLLKVPLLNLFTHPAVIAIIVAHFVTNWGRFYLFDWMPTYFTSLGFPLFLAGAWSAINAVVWTLSSMAAGVVADRLINKRWFRLITVRRLMNTIGLVGPSIFLTVLSFAAVDRTVAVILMIIALGLAGVVRAGYTVNHLDIAPRYSSVIFSISTTIAIIPGVVNVQLVGIMLEATNNDWTLPFMVSVGVYLIGAIVYLKFSRGKPISKKDLFKKHNDDKDEEAEVSEGSIIEEFNMD